MYSSIFLMSFRLTFNNISDHFNVDLLNRFMLWNGNRHASRFAECVMATPASRCFHHVAVAFQYLAQFIEAQIVCHRQNSG